MIVSVQRSASHVDIAYLDNDLTDRYLTVTAWHIMLHEYFMGLVAPTVKRSKKSFFKHLSADQSPVFARFAHEGVKRL